MHILLTRPLQDCLDMILKFQLMGHQVSHLPLLSVNKINHGIINIFDYKGIIFTSANSLKFLDLKEIDKKILCFCVGRTTEKKTRSLGFQNVISANGNVENLKEIILQNFDKKKGKLIYFSGETISINLDEQLKNEGYDVKRVINYSTSHIEKFDEKFVNELKKKIPDIVYIYSQNSASSFLNFIKVCKLESEWMNTNLMCIGEKASSILNEMKWKKIFLFNPGEEEVVLYKI